MSLSFVTLTLDLYDGQGNPEIRGLASFVPSAVLTQAGVEIIGQDPVPCVFHAAGVPSVRLLATDSPGLVPAGWTWGVTFTGQTAPPSGFAFFLAANPMTFTATNAAPCVFTGSGSACASGTGVQLSGGSLPAGFTAGTTYYVVSASGTTFQLAATPGGAALGSTGSGSGSVIAVQQFLSNLIAASPGTAFQAYMPLPSGTPGAGQVPVATGSGMASEWGTVSGGGGFASPMTTLGDLLYENATPAAARLAGDTSNTRKFLRGQASGGVAQAPAWDTLQSGDIPANAANTSGTAAALSATLAPGQGGTGQTTLQAALDALAGATTSGQVLRGDGTHVVLAAIAAGDLPAGTTSTRGALQLDGTAGDIQPSPATQAAGSVGKPADAGHVHGQPAVFAPGGLTGATAASRYAGATTSGPPQAGTFTAGDWVLAQDGPVWLCSTGGSPGNWKQSGDQPWQFRPETSGAKRDGKFLTDGAMTATSTLTSASAGFTAADVGKYVLVWGAITATNSQPGYLFATITAFTNSTTVTLSAAATNTVTSTGVLYGTDDTAALQSAVNAATTYSLTGGGALGQVLLSEGIYCSGATAATNATTLNKTAISIPIVTATAGVKAQVEITGAGSSQLPHWQQVQPPQSGSIIAAMNTGGSLNTSPGYGPSSIMAGPVLGYGGGGGTFSNMHLKLQGFTILVPVSAGAYCGPDLYGLGQATVDDVSYLPIAVIPTCSTWPALAPLSGTQYGGPTYYPTYSFGLRMPSSGNNAVSDIGSYTSYFTQISLICSEHAMFASLKTLFSVYGILPMTSAGGTMSHGISGLNWCCEEVRYPVGSVSSGYFALDTAIGIVVARLDLETYTSIVNDAAGKLYGDIGFGIIASAGGYLSSSQYAAGGTSVKLRRIEAAQGPVASFSGASLPPASGAAWNNWYYRDAWITLYTTAGVIAGVSIDSTPQYTGGGPGIGFASACSFLLPSGHSYTPVYTGTLTHTVSLL